MSDMESETSTPTDLAVARHVSSDVWGCIAHWLLPSEFVRLTRCSSFMFDPSERHSLWHHFCYLEGFARRAEQSLLSGSDCAVLSESDGSCWWAGPEVAWEESFRLNADAQVSGNHVFAYIRVRDEDVRVPTHVDEGDDRRNSATCAWLFDHCWRPRSCLSRAFRRMLRPCHVPLRFRELSSGRPGMLVRRARFFEGHSPTSAVAEWPIGRDPGGVWHWSLPPHTLEDAEAAEEWEDYPAVRSGPHPWGRGYGWLVELEIEAGERKRMALFQASHETSRWIHVGKRVLASKISLGQLCNEVTQHLQSLGFPSGLEACLAGTEPSTMACQVSASSLLLADLRWTQGERLQLKRATVPKNLRQAFFRDLDGFPGFQSGASSSSKSEEAVLVTRDTARPWTRLSLTRTRESIAELDSSVRQDQPRSGSRGSLAAGTSDSNLLEVQKKSSAKVKPGRSRSAGLRAVRSRPTNLDCPASGAYCTDGGGGISDSDAEEINSATAVDRGGQFSRAVSEQASQDHRRTLGPLISEQVSQPKGNIPYQQRLLMSSCGTRQFEFHPTRKGTLLAGRKDGSIAVIDHEADKTTHFLDVDSHPILGISWLHTNPQWAVIGVSQSGATSLVRYDESKPGPMENVRLEPFKHLSSLSVNCTDEYFMTSGFCVDLGLYDIVTGRRLNLFRGMHQNFINILRFAHRSPHVFATASFDHTCKVWDLRQPMAASRPVRHYKTDTMNVMCSFSPDDRHMLCSGVDATLHQFSLDSSSDASSSRFPIPAMHSNTNYRRSIYLTDGDMVATAATNESVLRIYQAATPHRFIGQLDVKGCLGQRLEHSQTSMRHMQNAPRSREYLDARERPRTSLSREGNTQQPQGVKDEYVQSLRCHPDEPRLLGALLSTSETQPDAYISMIRLGNGTATRAHRASLGL
mmetsp:Transcript_48513/g.87165  ORF Transcript_48513/g.87165 Transcript_48513/m.87165 type:complete len:918 (+) Transcript_48513:144-2897(+)